MIEELQLGAHPSMSAILGGTQLSKELVADINRRMGSVEYFGTIHARYSTHNQEFVQKFVDPVRIANRLVATTAQRVVNQDYFRPITTEEELRHCAPCMMEGILAMPRMSELFSQGRISGWGFSPEGVETVVDQYSRILDLNGQYEIHSSFLDKDDCVTESHTEESTDPLLSPEERDALRESRAFVQYILDTSRKDPTDLDNIRG